MRVNVTPSLVVVQYHPVGLCWARSFMPSGEMVSVLGISRWFAGRGGVFQRPTISVHQNPARIAWFALKNESDIGTLALDASTGGQCRQKRKLCSDICPSVRK
jgi:hypothetical protein